MISNLKNFNNFIHETYFESILVKDRKGRILTSIKIKKSINQDELKNIEKLIINIEDRSFYKNIGISVKGILRALYINIKSQGLKQGGSSITQQVVRMIFPCRNRIARKIYEFPMAVLFTVFFSKRKILNFYLNNLYLGKGILGFNSARRIYLSNKKNFESDLALTSLTTRPEFWIRNPEKLNEKAQSYVKRNNEFANLASLNDACKKIHDNSQKIIFFENYDFLSSVKISDLSINQFTVTTPLHKELNDTLIEKMGKYGKKYDFGIVVFDYRKFQVLSMHGMQNEMIVKRNILQDKIKVGSLLKPFLITCFLENGFDIHKKYNSKPLSLNLDGKIWNVRNYQNIYREEIDLINAIAYSDNSVCVQALLDIGLDRFKATLVKLGVIDNSETIYHSIILGSSVNGIKIESVIRAYSSIMGLKESSHSPLSINRHNKSISPIRSIIETRRAMKSVLKFGTGLKLKNANLVGAKTGTDQNNLSIIGYDRNVAILIHAQQRQKEIFEAYQEDEKGYGLFHMLREALSHSKKIIKNEKGNVGTYGSKTAA